MKMRRVDYRRTPKRKMRIPLEKVFQYETFHMTSEREQACKLTFLPDDLDIGHSGDKRTVTWHNFVIGTCSKDWTYIEGKVVHGWSLTLHLETGDVHPSSTNRHEAFFRTLPNRHKLAEFIPKLIQGVTATVEHLIVERDNQIRYAEQRRGKDTEPYDVERHPQYSEVRWCESEMRKLSYAYGRVLIVYEFMTTPRIETVDHYIEKWNSDGWDKPLKNPPYEPRHPFEPSRVSS